MATINRCRFIFVGSVTEQEYLFEKQHVSLVLKAIDKELDPSYSGNRFSCLKKMILI